MNHDLRIAAAFRATFFASAALLVLVFGLSLTHHETAPPATQPAAGEYGWPV